MRLRRLTLARYGKFTDRSIDFGERPGAGPDMHIVYGPNEAGKSTALAGYLDLLFGIEPQSRYGFLHPYDTMRLGGLLELSVGPRDLVRIKRPAPTLRDAGGALVQEALVQGDLGGLDRNAYRAMFSLDDDTLEAGGNSILAANGEVGELLFSASAGLAELSRTLAEIRAAAASFTRPGARSGELYAMKIALDELKRARAAADLFAADYKRLADERDRSAGRYDAARSEMSTAQVDLALARRTLAALPHLASLRSCRERLAPWTDLPSAPDGWLAELPALQEAESRHRSATERADAEIQRLTAEIGALRVDARALGLGSGLDLLVQLAARETTAAIDLPVRRQELAVASVEVDGILARLDRRGETEPERLILTASQAARFNGLLETRSGIAEKVAKAREEFDKAVLDLGEARNALRGEGDGGTADSLAAVRRALQALETSDHAARIGTAAANRKRHAEALEQRKADLRPWTGGMPALAAMDLPAADTVAAWHETALALAAKMAQRTEAAEKLDADLARQIAVLGPGRAGKPGGADRRPAGARGGLGRPPTRARPGDGRRLRGGHAPGRRGRRGPSGPGARFGRAPGGGTRGCRHAVRCRPGRGPPRRGGRRGRGPCLGGRQDFRAERPPPGRANPLADGGLDGAAQRRAVTLEPACGGGGGSPRGGEGRRGAARRARRSHVPGGNPDGHGSGRGGFRPGGARPRWPRRRAATESCQSAWKWAPSSAPNRDPFWVGLCR